MMRTNLDFSPLSRASIGFDRMFDRLENSSRSQSIDNWPPYDIVKTGEDDYQITLAVAGFRQEELAITQEPNLLVVAGEKSGESDGQYLHRGVARRSFRRRFELADHVNVAGASLINGLLTVELKREIPEAMKPRRIEITSTAGSEAEPRQIEGKQSKAAHPQTD